MKTIFYKIIRLFFPDKFKVQTFTYYVPSPPKRSKGYREKEFDRVFYNFINDGLELIDLKTERDNEGMWIITTVRSLRPNVEINLDEDYLSGQNTNEEIDGIYYIQD